MTFKKYKYYFRKPRSEIVKDIFKAIAVTGAIAIAATSPYFIVNLLKGFKKFKKYSKKQVYSTFNNLKKAGLLKIDKNNRQIYISLTEEGKKKAGMFQIDALEIKKSEKWDGKWRLIIFDIGELRRIEREAFRGKLKRLGFYKLQKSIWIHAFDCRAEAEILTNFFGLSENEVRFIESSNIGDDIMFKKHFNL